MSAFLRKEARTFLLQVLDHLQQLARGSVTRKQARAVVRSSGVALSYSNALVHSSSSVLMGELEFREVSNFKV